MSASIRPLTIFSGIKVVELAGLAPVPLLGQILADFGANVQLVEKKSSSSSFIDQRLTRGKTRITLDYSTELLKLEKLVQNADVLLDPFRPGALEGLGLDPVKLCSNNQKLIVARVSGYGQTTKLSQIAGHDLNYAALSGLLPILTGAAGHKNRPFVAPFAADFASGAMMTAFAVAGALFYREKNGGKGAIIDSSMTHNLTYLGTWLSAYSDLDFLWNDKDGFFAGNNPFYRCYRTKDNKFMAVACLEQKFRDRFLNLLQLAEKSDNVIELTTVLEDTFANKSQQYWTNLFLEEEACVTPVLDMPAAADLHRGTLPGSTNDAPSSGSDADPCTPVIFPQIWDPEEFEAVYKLAQEKFNSKL